jgi:hypothetical protein
MTQGAHPAPSAATIGTRGLNPPPNGRAPTGPMYRRKPPTMTQLREDRLLAPTRFTRQGRAVPRLFISPPVPSGPPPAHPSPRKENSRLTSPPPLPPKERIDRNAPAFITRVFADRVASPQQSKESPAPGPSSFRAPSKRGMRKLQASSLATRRSCRLLGQQKKGSGPPPTLTPPTTPTRPGQ